MRNLRRYIPHPVRRRLPARLCRVLDQHVCGYVPACVYSTKAERAALARWIAAQRTAGNL